MFQKVLIPYTKLTPVKSVLLRKRIFVNFHICAWLLGLIFMCILIMSFMIVKVTSTELYYHNQTAQTATPEDEHLLHYYQSVTEVPESVDTVYKKQRLAVAATSNPTLSNSQSSDEASPTSADATHEKQAATVAEMRTKRRQQEPDAPQELHAIAGETAYLLERADGNGYGRERELAHEQPVYGTWRTKARRPPLQHDLIVAAAAVAAAEEAEAEAGADAEAEAATVSNREDSRSNVAKTYQNHVYERLPRRSSTVTSVKSEMRDQIPRPPRLTSRQPSLLARRQYMETPKANVSLREELSPQQRPKPFHFPHDGPLPEEFKKAESERNEVNNIQDILQHMHLGGGSMKTPQMLMMPTGLHIAGSFKNLKSSGIANFFRNRRNKKHVQIAFPVPMPLPVFAAYPPPGMGMSVGVGALGQPYQRVALDQFYPFKPRSPQEVNLLAMHQQLKASRSKSKSKKKQKAALALANGNLMSRPYFTADASHLIAYPQLLAMNATQKPKLKHIPFKVNLDIYPVMPPTKDYRVQAFPKEEIKLATSMRPMPSIMHNPFANMYSYPITPSAVALPYHMNPYDHHHQHQQHQHIYNPVQFSAAAQTGSSVQQPQSSHSKILFPDQLSQQQTFQAPSDLVQPSAVAAAASSASQMFSNSKANPLMVHLNVFPKQKQLTSTTQSTNPFYGSTFSINRNTIHEELESPSAGSVEPRSQPLGYAVSASLSPQQQPQSISRSDTVDLQAFTNFDQPIVAAELTGSELPQPAALVSNKLDSSDASPYYDHIEARSNFNFNPNANVEQLASEAQTASLFRFPVEDLIQFQVGDAL